MSRRSIGAIGSPRAISRAMAWEEPDSDPDTERVDELEALGIDPDEAPPDDDGGDFYLSLRAD